MLSVCSQNLLKRGKLTKTLGILCIGLLTLGFHPALTATEPVWIQADVLGIDPSQEALARRIMGGARGIQTSADALSKLKQQLNPTVILLPDLEAAPGRPAVVKDLRRCIAPAEPTGVIRKEAGRDVAICYPASASLEDTGTWFAAAAKPKGTNKMTLEWSFRYRRADWVETEIDVTFPDGSVRSCPWRTPVFEGCVSSSRHTLKENESSFAFVRLKPSVTDMPERLFLIVVRAE